jgi:hypothetical protein
MNGTDDTIAAASGDTNNKQKLSLLILLNQTFSIEQKQRNKRTIYNLQEELGYVIEANPQDYYNFGKLKFLTNL